MYHVSDLMLCCKQGSFGDVGIDTVKWGFEGQQFFFFFFFLGGGGLVEYLRGYIDSILINQGGMQTNSTIEHCTAVTIFLQNCPVSNVILLVV